MKKLESMSLADGDDGIYNIHKNDCLLINSRHVLIEPAMFQIYFKH